MFDANTLAAWYANGAVSGGTTGWPAESTSSLDPCNPDMALLPVTLTDLKEEQQNNLPLVQWNTVAESHNAGFIIQHSADGQNWTTAGFQSSKSGNGTGALYYAYPDEKPFPDINYYRLKQQNMDGAAIISKVISLRFSNSGQTIKLSPNPAISFTTIRNVNAGDIIQVTGIDGIHYKTVIAGSPTQTIDIANLPGGIYTVKHIERNGTPLSSLKFLKK